MHRGKVASYATGDLWCASLDGVPKIIFFPHIYFERPMECSRHLPIHHPADIKNYRRTCAPKNVKHNVNK